MTTFHVTINGGRLVKHYKTSDAEPESEDPRYNLTLIK